MKKKPKSKPKRKNMFSGFGNRTTLDNSHDVGWRWARRTARREKLEKQEKIYGNPIPQLCHVVGIQWSEKGTGFGELVFFTKDGVLYCDNECRNRKDVRRIMRRLVDQAVFTEDLPRNKSVSTWPSDKDIDIKVYKKKKS